MMVRQPFKESSSRPPDLGVFDIKMPRMDGIELLQKIRASQLPVIFLTSKDDELDEALGLGMGADDYITKPFSQRLLLARIRRSCVGLQMRECRLKAQILSVKENC